MARYKHIDNSPRFLAVDLERQLLPGTLGLAMARSNWLTNERAKQKALRREHEEA
jgi:hypothetical protein